MAQFDVYHNPSKKTHKAIPFVLDIQNEIISDIATRLVIPLGSPQYFKQVAILAPCLKFEGADLILLTPQLASVPSKILKNPAGSLLHFRDKIMASLDFAITGI